MLLLIHCVPRGLRGAFRGVSFGEISGEFPSSRFSGSFHKVGFQGVSFGRFTRSFLQVGFQRVSFREAFGGDEEFYEEGLSSAYYWGCMLS
jgi:hypothetical protein